MFNRRILNKFWSKKLHVKKVRLNKLSALFVLSCGWFPLCQAQIVTNCKVNASGITVCAASESQTNLMNLECSSVAPGQTNCRGDYSDKTSARLAMDCKHGADGSTRCSGSTSDGTSFNLSCQPSSLALQCSISDNQGESLTLECKKTARGVPDCSGLDNSGARHQLRCSGIAGESASCSAD